MRKRMKEDELRFRHAAHNMEGADLSAIAARARVPMRRAKSLFKRWRGASGLDLPPLPAEEADAVEAASEHDADDQASAAVSADPAVEPENVAMAVEPENVAMDADAEE